MDTRNIGQEMRNPLSWYLSVAEGLQATETGQCATESRRKASGANLRIPSDNVENDTAFHCVCMVGGGGEGGGGSPGLGNPCLVL